ncbi:AMP-binding protein, partial [Cellulomonas biazotea]|uniref:AMP-binding protein n=1 Tax=Cellulomonas biazotea TaxID=1709 RepID=UPI0013EF4669
MPEFSSPTDVADDPGASISTLLADRLARDPQGTFAEVQTSVGGAWRPVTVTEFADEVTAVAQGLVASGIQPGDRVALMSRTRYEWTLLDFAIWAAGAVGVPVYETSSAEQVRWIASDAGVRFAVVETAAHAAAVAQVRDDLPGLTEVLVLDEGAVATLVERGRGGPP